MRNIVKITSVLLFLTVSIGLFAQEKSIPKEILGKWGFTLENPDTGETYKGSCNFQEKDSQVKATLQIGNEAGVTSTALRPNDNGKFYADMTVEGYLLYLAFALSGDKVTCTVDTGSFDFPIQMTRE